MGATSRRALWLSLAIATVIADAGPAHATDKRTRARAHYEAGAALFRMERYAEAAREFRAGYTLTPRPGFLINLGQSYKKLGNITEARRCFERFLDEAPDGPQRENVRQLIAELPPETKVVEPADAEAPTTVEAENPVTSAPSAPIADHGRRKRIAGYVLLGATVALVAAGGTLVGLAYQQNDFLNNPPPGWTYDPSIEKKRDAMNGAGIALLTTSAVSLVSGAVLAAISRPERQKSVQVAVDVTPNRASIQVGGRF